MARGEKKSTQRMSYSIGVAPEEDSKEKLVREFQRHVAIEEASTPPAAWYTDSAFADLELRRVFSRGWQAVGKFFYYFFPFCRNCETLA